MSIKKRKIGEVIFIVCFMGVFLIMANFNREIGETAISKETKGIGLYNDEKDIEEFINKGGLYLVGIEGEKEQGFITWFQKEKSIRNIELEFYTTEDYAKDFTIEIYTNGQWETVVDKKEFRPMYRSKYFSVNLEEEKNAEGIKLTATAFKGQQRLLLRGVNLNTNICQYTSMEQLMEEIMGKYEYIELSYHQKCMLMMDWINHNIGIGITDSDPYITIKDGVGACGNLSTLMASMAEEEGWKTRLINLYNYPVVGNGHTLVEIEWGGENGISMIPIIALTMYGMRKRERTGWIRQLLLLHN